MPSLRFFLHREGLCCAIFSVVVVVLSLENGSGVSIHLVLILHAAHVELDLVDVAAVVTVQLALNARDIALGHARI